MGTSERKKQLLTLLEKEGFMTVERLSHLTYTSPSSIRRDLTELQNKGLVRRTHGGAMPVDTIERLPSLPTRMTKNVQGKRRIAKAAAELLCDGMIVMLDGSSTASFLVPHLAAHKRITLFTNNMETALKAIELGIDTHCIGGHSVNRSAALAGEEAYRAVRLLHPDLLFFSSQSLDQNGVISDSNGEENHLRMLMLENTAKSVFLCDHEKFEQRSAYTLTTLDQIDYAFFDEPWEALSLSPRNPVHT